MKTIQSVWIAIKVEDENPTEEGYYKVLGYTEGTAYWHQDKQCWNRPDNFHKPTHWLKPTEAILYSKEEHDAVVNCIELHKAYLKMIRNCESQQHLDHLISEFDYDKKVKQSISQLNKPAELRF